LSNDDDDIDKTDEKRKMRRYSEVETPAACLCTCAVVLKGGAKEGIKGTEAPAERSKANKRGRKDGRDRRRGTASRLQKREICLYFSDEVIHKG
jgi:hypothetical protein